MSSKTLIQSFDSKPMPGSEVGQSRKTLSRANFQVTNHEMVIPGWAAEEYAKVSKDFERQMAWILGGPNVKE